MTTPQTDALILALTFTAIALLLHRRTPPRTMLALATLLIAFATAIGLVMAAQQGLINVDIQIGTAANPARAP